MAERHAATVRFTPFQWRVLRALRTAGLPPGAEPLPIQRVLVAALLEVARLRGIDAASAAAAAVQELDEAVTR